MFEEVYKWIISGMRKEDAPSEYGEVVRLINTAVTKNSSIIEDSLARLDDFSTRKKSGKPVNVDDVISDMRKILMRND